MNQISQEVIALGIVALTFLGVIFTFYRTHLAAPVSGWLLKMGYVKLAMKIRKQWTPKSGCSNCKA